MMEMVKKGRKILLVCLCLIAIFGGAVSVFAGYTRWLGTLVAVAGTVGLCRLPSPREFFPDPWDPL